MPRSDDRPFTCGNCGRSFRSYPILELHSDEECAAPICRRCKRQPAQTEGLCYVCHYYS